MIHFPISKLSTHSALLWDLYTC